METLSHHPLGSFGTAFGIGLVAGLFVGLSIGAQRKRDMSWRERWMK